MAFKKFLTLSVDPKYPGQSQNQYIVSEHDDRSAAEAYAINQTKLGFQTIVLKQIAEIVSQEPIAKDVI